MNPSSSSNSLSIVCFAGVLGGFHQMLFPNSHLISFFVSGKVPGKELDLKVSTEVMRWLGFSNILMCTLMGIVVSEKRLPSQTLLSLFGGFCLLDVVAVKIPYWNAPDVVNPMIPRFVGSTLLLAGLSMLGLAALTTTTSG